MPRMARGLHHVGSLVAILFFAGPAPALDITACGQAVPPGEQGTLMVDLLCDRLPQGNPPAVTVGSKGTLNLNGHTITAPHNTAVAAAGGRITVTGPGDLTGGDVAIQGVGRVTVTNVSIHDNEIGIITDLERPVGRVTATNVSIVNSIGGESSVGLGVQANTVIADGLTVTNATFDGIFVHRIMGTNVIASDNGPGYPTSGIGFGIDAVKVRLTNLTAQNNNGNGVMAERIRLTDSTVTGNTGQDNNNVPSNIDIFAETRPQLENTICGRSNGWHVCQNDAGSPSGAFLDEP